MKKIIISVLLLLLIGFIVYKITKNDDVTGKELEMIVSYLASDELEGRGTGSVGIEKAAGYIENVFKKSNIKPYFESYRQNFKWSAVDAYNVVGYIEGNDPKLKNEIVVIGAHYDHLGNSKKIDGDDIANGANDNASGTSAVMEIALHFAHSKSNKRSIIIALFSAEEQGMLGSAHLAKALKEKNINLYTMLNFEMIGVPMENEDYATFLTGYELSNMSEKINEYANYKLTGFLKASKENDLFKRADNYPFYQEFNVPCHTISSYNLTNYEAYHGVGDEANKLDYVHMATVINKAIPAIESICNTPTKEIKLN